MGACSEGLLLRVKELMVHQSKLAFPSIDEVYNPMDSSNFWIWFKQEDPS